jgi:hypothetical protein
MAPSIHLVNPAPDFPTYFGAEVHAASGFGRAAGMADLAIPTVAALVPGDFEVSICDESLEPVDLDCAADFVGITGKVSQWRRMQALARAFRERGKTVLIGGPHASLAPDVVRPHCDVLVRGELEGIAGRLFGDLRRGAWQAEYEGGRPELSQSPVPRWDLYPNHRARSGTLQTARGCPFECEFCDVIQYVGRQQRHKPIPQVIRELETLYRLGYREVFIADDNFTAYRGRAKALLEALRDWNAASDEGVVFTTQVSIDAARDEELLRLCAEAGLAAVFVGIETPSEASLREARKRQNLRRDLVADVGRFLDHGIAVWAGMIVGFDADGPEIFERQYEFAMASAIPVFSLGALVAPIATPLHARLAQAGRLVERGSEVAASPLDTNVVPLGMSSAQLFDGLRRLCNRLYEPRAFGSRVARLVERLALAQAAGDGADGLRPLRAVERELLEIGAGVARMGPAEAELVRGLGELAAGRPALERLLGYYLFQYAQVRHLYEAGRVWEPHAAA